MEHLTTIIEFYFIVQLLFLHLRQILATLIKNESQPFENNLNELLLLDFLYNLPFWKNLSTPFIYSHECLSIVSVVCLAILFIWWLPLRETQNVSKNKFKTFKKILISQHCWIILSTKKYEWGTNIAYTIYHLM